MRGGRAHRHHVFVGRREAELVLPEPFLELGRIHAARLGEIREIDDVMSRGHLDVVNTNRRHQFCPLARSNCLCVAISSP